MTYETTPDEQRVIAWLRKRADASGDVPHRICNSVANAIEKGQHHDTPNAE